jgi:Fe2+ or Zn2+ uptake regulation protein
LTKTRLAFIDYIFEKHALFSAEDIFSSLSAQAGLKIDIATVYRNLKLMEKQGILKRSSFSSDKILFELVRDSKTPRPTLVACRICKRLAEVNVKARTFRTEEKAITALGYVSVSHTLEFSGVCPACATSHRGAKARYLSQF